MPNVLYIKRLVIIYCYSDILCLNKICEYNLLKDKLILGKNMRITFLFIIGLLLSTPVYACITPFLLPPHDVKVLLEKEPSELKPMDMMRVDEFKRDMYGKSQRIR